MTLVRKTHADVNQKGMEFVLSDATADRYGDIIEASGWDLKNFKNNPVALFNHDANFPIGRWENLRVVKGQLRGHLQMAPRGTSSRIDELLNLIDAGILRAVSVGFLPKEHEPIGKGHGSRYLKSELVETSLVSIPANPNALAVAKAFNTSRETLDVVFGKNASEAPQIVRRGSAPASKPKPSASSLSGNSKMNLSQRIAAAQSRIVALQDQLSTHLEGVNDESPDEGATAITDELTGQIETQTKALESLKKAEATMAKALVTQPAAVNNGSNGDDVVLPTRHNMQKLFATPEKKIAPMDLIVKALAVDIKHFGEGRKRDIKDVLKEEYGDNQMGESVRTVMSRMVTKAAAIPADTTTSGWADTLVQTAIGDFIESLMPYSIYPALRAKGESFTFGRNGTISLPARTTSTTLAGSFVAQGAAIPVRQGAFSPITITPRKMGVITTMTREITEHSTPQIEAILKSAMLEDTAVAIDTVLLDATAASTTRPAGLKNGISKISVSATASIVGFAADLKTLYSALIVATNGNVRRPCWIMNPSDVMAAAMLTTTTGDTPYREEISRGTLLGVPILQTTTGLSDMMAIIDAADFATATGDTPQFSVSDQAVLHMEDTSPAALSAVATPNTVAAPLRSLFQTDSLAIRMILDINWVKRRAGIFQWADTMVWN
jgi:HK97 family phage major capsid protein/HK97 family phage prohead protease